MPLPSTKLLVTTALILSLCACSWWRSIDTPAETKKAEGTRLEALKSDTQLVPDSSLAATPPELPPAESFPETLSVRVSETIGNGRDFTYGVTPQPVIASNVIYVMDAAGNISAHDAQNISRVLWRAAGVADEDENTMLTGGLTMSGGVLYAVSGNGLIAALDAATGRELWRQDIKIPVRSTPAVDGGRVFIVTVDSQIFALDAATGASVWTTRGIDEGSSFLALASPLTVNGGLIAPLSSGELKVVQQSDGSEIWSDMVSASKRMIATSDFNGFGGDPVIAGNALYVASASGILAAYRLDNGLRVWEQPVVSMQTPLVVGNALFLLSSDATLIAFNRLDGRVFWVATLPRYEDAKDKKDPYHWSGPVMAGGKLYVAGAHGEMKAFNPTNGSEIGTIEIPDDIYATPLVSGMRMIVVRKNAELVALY